MKSKTFECRCGKTIKESEACWYHVGEGNIARECASCAKSKEVQEELETKTTKCKELEAENSKLRSFLEGIRDEVNRAL